MKFDDYPPLVVRMAQEVLDMHHENKRLRAENEELREYRQKYIDELDRSISHSKSMLNGILDLAMTPGVLEAIADSKEVKS